MRKLASMAASLMLIAGLAVGLRAQSATGKRPLSSQEIIKLAASDVAESRLIDLVKELGISFAPTRPELDKLRKSGVPASVIEAVKKQVPRGQSQEFYMQAGDELNQEGRTDEAAVYYRLGQGLPAEDANSSGSAEHPASQPKKAQSPNRKAAADSKVESEDAWFMGGQTSAVATTKSSGIFINNRELTSKQIAEIKKIYMFVAPPGRYWYDTRSGLWGLMGHEAAGFLNPGHDFGPLPSNASNGNTGVFINGRELNMAEAMYCKQVFGAVYQGHWWLDGRTGNIGVEGNPMPLANVYMILQQRGRSGGGGYSWSSKNTGAYGGSDGNCSYVSIPGSGSVMTGNCD